MRMEGLLRRRPRYESESRRKSGLGTVLLRVDTEGISTYRSRAVPPIRPQSSRVVTSAALRKMHLRGAHAAGDAGGDREPPSGFSLRGPSVPVVSAWRRAKAVSPAARRRAGGPSS